MKNALLIALLFGLGCGDDNAAPMSEVGLAFATTVVSFDEGENAGFGSQDVPDVVLGPPDGKGQTRGGLDVLSLGTQGSIVLGFDGDIFDGDGPDFVVFENAFYPGGDEEAVFAELAEVAVSADGEQWTAFPCSIEPDSPGRWPGCAGWTPTEEFDPNRDDLTTDDTGGDGFDLNDIGVESARYVRITDLQTEGVEPSAGFDQDAVGVFHIQ